MSITRKYDQNSAPYWECDGMCFPQAVVLNDIFALQGIFNGTGMSLGANENSDVYYLQELTRLVSLVSIYSRNQLTSYFHSVDADLSKSKKLQKIRELYVGADNAIFSKVGVMMCPKNGQVPVTFYDMITKFCHVEKWKYPLEFSVPSVVDDVYGELIDLEELSFENEPQSSFEGRMLVSNVLEVEVTISGKSVASGQVEVYRVLPWEFANAARVFLTDCEDCQLIQAEPEPSCGAEGSVD